MRIVAFALVLLAACTPPPPELNGPASTCDDCVKKCEAQGWQVFACQTPLDLGADRRMYAQCFCRPKGER